MVSHLVFTIHGEPCQNSSYWIEAKVWIGFIDVVSSIKWSPKAHIEQLISDCLVNWDDQLIVYNWQARRP